MNKLIMTVAALLVCVAPVQTQAQPQPQPQPQSQHQPQFQPPSDGATQKPQIEDLGNQHYRIGAIEIDKANSVFKVSGTVIRDAPPLEFLVIARGGHKAYEGLLEVNADAFEFNLACILIGLDGSGAVPWAERNVDEPAQGDAVSVEVRWQRDGKSITVPGAQLLAAGEPVKPVTSDEWVYSGSVVLPDGRYLADLSGTLVGFVHRDETIIEHRQGIGLGRYGSVVPNPAMALAVGTPIELIVSRPGSGGSR